MNTTLQSLTKLSDNVKIYVPSTMDVNNAIDPQQYIDSVLSRLSEKFWGSTAYDARWFWNSENDGLVGEAVKICESYTSKLTDTDIEYIVDIARQLKTDMKQEAVSIEVNNSLYFV